MNEKHIPGIAVCIIHDGEVVCEKGFGMSNITLETKVDPRSTLFRVASISKSMTSAVIGRLEQYGYMDIDSSIYTYSEWFPKKEWDFTIRQVGGHIAGIRTYKGNEFYSDTNYTSVKDAVSIFKNDSLLFQPSIKYQYSTYGWNLLSATIEDVVGRLYPDIMRDSLFTVLGMKHTFMNDIFQVGRDKSRTGYYRLNEERVEEEPTVDLSNKWAGGGFESTAYDVALFGYEMAKGVYLTDSIISDYTTAMKLSDGTSTNYGFGWVVRTDDDGRKWFGHAGGGVGATAMLMVYPKEKVSIAILTNLSNAPLKSYYESLAKAYLETLD